MFLDIGGPIPDQYRGSIAKDVRVIVLSKDINDGAKKFQIKNKQKNIYSMGIDMTGY
jgi:hypothetical protein